MPTDWEDILLAYLHDPPDKARDIRGHEGRAARLAGIALGRDITPTELHRDSRTEDQLGSVVERVPMPTAGTDGRRAVGPEEDRLQVFHPLSGHKETLEVAALEQAAPAAVLVELVRGLDPPRARFLAVWRRWREELSKLHADWSRLPADSRLPDHTIWNHLDTVAGLRPALAGTHGAALLAFALGPVQPFIAAARTVRDLWTGSYLLSWLTFAAMRPILDRLGPAAFVFPALRGHPLLDLYLRKEAQVPAGLVDEPAREQLLLPCLPNRFVAVVPNGREGEEGRALARECEERCRKEWRDLCATVREELAKQVPELDPLGLWDAQVISFFEVQTAVLPERECRDETIGRLLATSGAFADALPNAARVRALADAIPPDERPGFSQKSAGMWMGQMEVLGRAAAARRSVRHVPDYRPPGQVPPKCSLLGSYEQMGPARLEQSNEFWKDAVKRLRLGGTRLRTTERLCAVSLVKRFAWPAYLARELGRPSEERRFADSATIAAARWLNEGEALDWRNEKKWSGQWLHWSQPEQEKDEEPVPDSVWPRIREKKENQGKPPAYYAVLMLDGDRLGKWLRGELTPRLEEVLHPKLHGYFAALKGADGGLTARRPVGPALHASISEALANFALHFVPQIVGKHDGELIYAGGDDVLALLPTRAALACAAELERTYRREWEKDASGQVRLLMGARATVSAGLAVVHYKEDLRFALKAARDTEKAAKSAGRNALTLTVCRRSGEHTSALVPWSMCEQVTRLVEIFRCQVSDRWAYKLRAELPTLGGKDIPWSLVRAEIGRLLKRLEKSDRDQIADPALQLLDAYHEELSGSRRQWDDARVLAGYVTLCQSASFLARGRDE